MKKFILIMFAVLFSSILIAQEETYVSDDEVVNKKGVSILPKAGDFALGIDASPFINLVGNMIRINDFTGPFNDPSAFNFVDGSSIYAKYFLSDNTAVRARLNIMMMSETLNNNVTDDANTSDPDARVTDSWKYSENGIGLGLGYEMRRGKGRLQAFYGGEINLTFGGGSKDEYTYGNAMNDNDSIPTTTIDWTTGTSVTLDHRITDQKTSGGFGFGLRGFVGVEYFIFPNVSFGGEFGLGFDLNSVGDGEVNTESWNYTDHRRDTNSIEIAGSNGFNLGNDNLGGNIFILIHF